MDGYFSVNPYSLIMDVIIRSGCSVVLVSGAGRRKPMLRGN